MWWSHNLAVLLFLSHVKTAIYLGLLPIPTAFLV